MLCFRLPVSGCWGDVCYKLEDEGFNAVLQIHKYFTFTSLMSFTLIHMTLSTLIWSDGLGFWYFFIFSMVAQISGPYKKTTLLLS